MVYSDFEKILSNARMSRYLSACNGNTKKAMTLYRHNLRLSQELLTLISCFEVALRNAINTICVHRLGNDWLKDGAMSGRGGIFDNRQCHLTAQNINEAVKMLNHNYSHNKLVAELGFGFWRYMFAPNQYRATGQLLLRIFPARPTSTQAMQYNNTYIFNQLAKINSIRNRIAHHEPVCFQIGSPVKSTLYVRQHYALVQQFFQWMSIDAAALLYGLDHINTVCNQIDSL